jgi:putative membrane protein
MRNKLSAVALLATLGLAACNQPGAGNTATSTVENTMSETHDMATNVIDDARTAVTSTPSPQDFVDKAAQSDAFEIAAAKLAESQATSPDVKKFAGEMIKAHTKSTASIKKAAAEATPAVTPHPALTADQQSALTKLTNDSRTDFDKDYLSGQVDAHESALALVQRYADSGTEAGLKAAAAKLAPVVQEHLQMARDLKDKLGDQPKQ